ncbi:MULTISPECIES: hypothetical protein [unclassified Mycolicibacterium]|uniref:hypothetical protein n=1 Tax=unclassified Mycolicibacterium TaxID=2636767 RepID=UPI0012DE6599|nr:MULTISPECIES: hypothetical protein [unclassified Mycolicibacterium]MUL82753.1 hypothetical protein [Mycolicibacterium sp. CBMA 329]MUL89088.1 hypothetical protein [Mycolicibacterium sp. CBMA 331]MUL97655.1 hypothetical protein [Mycolicibacterium sp. CBMA 334]MUM28671.1 hypothetical protein [Mycolicibacterium sp. CBMA 295]MUM38604.1 hypothetical protein [Mycolicibacterium sp. CBMA 247]
MSERSVTRWNTAAFVLYVLLLPAAFMEFMIAALAFGMATDGCHDAACDATYHEEPAILTVAIGVVVVLLSAGVWMIYGATRGKNVVAVPIIALFGLFAVFWLGNAVLH